MVDGFIKQIILILLVITMVFPDNVLRLQTTQGYVPPRWNGCNNNVLDDAYGNNGNLWLSR